MGSIPTFRHGKNTFIAIDSNDMSGFFNNSAWNNSVDTPETTAFGNLNKSYVAGLKNATLGLTGMFSAGAATDPDPIFSAVLGSATDTNVGLLPEGNVLTRRAFMMQGLVTTYGVTNPVAGMVSAQADFIADAGVDSGYILCASTLNITATGADPGAGNLLFADFGTALATSIAGVAFIFVIANTRDAGSVVFQLMESATGAAASFTNVPAGGAFTSIGFGARTTQRLTPTLTTSKRYLGASVTVTGGTSGSYNVIIVASKR